MVTMSEEGGMKRGASAMDESLDESPPKRQRSSAATIDALDVECVNTIRCLAADMVSKANSGHPGAPMGCAPIANALFRKIMKYSPAKPDWIARDRFILSNGHACALLYCALHLTGYDLKMDDLKKFRQLGSITPGHPESFLTPGVEVCTGPLGQGLSNAVGMALAEKHLAAVYNKPGYDLFDNYTYVLCGDGCLMEGVTSEASSLAGHLALNKLIVIYDDNKISIDGSTDLAFTEDVSERYSSYGWNVLVVEDGNNANSGQFEAAITMAQQSKKPTLIRVKTLIGFGSSNAGSHATHGAPLKPDDLKGVKEKFGRDGDESFVVGSNVKTAFELAGQSGNRECEEWHRLLEKYCTVFPELGAEIKRRIKGELKTGWQDALPKYKVGDKDKATRQYSSECLSALVQYMPELVGGCADLAPSCLTKHTDPFQKDTPAGRYIHYGVREHAMAAASNGLCAYGMFAPFCATFLVFYGYAYGSVRLSALSGFPVLYIATHDSIDLGEDGPTHQPIEMLNLLRATPNMLTIRPADGEETAGAYVCWLENRTRPTTVALSRSGAPHITGSSRAGVKKGAYVITEDAGFTVVLAASGQEVGTILDAKKIMNEKGVKVRVVSMPCWELFEEQPVEYQKSVLPPRGTPGVKVAYVEPTNTMGMHKYADICIGMEGFGCSAPGKAAKDHFGFTAPKIAEKVMAQL